MKINLLFRLIRLELNLFNRLFNKGDESCFDIVDSTNAKIIRAKLSKEELKELNTLIESTNKLIKSRYIGCLACGRFCKQRCFYE